METLTFYEKPGCKGNAIQQEKLREAGYELDIQNLLGQEWNKEKLLQFFGENSVHQCVNTKAPVITSGELKTESLSEEELLAKMIEEPMLIKRPLLFYNGEYCCGFDSPLVTKLLGETQEASSCQVKGEQPKCD